MLSLAPSPPTRESSQPRSARTWRAHYEQSEEGNTSSELVYDEFEEVVARIFYTKVWLRTPAAERPDLLETGFDAWLADEFVPRALDAVKRRKKGQAAKKM